MRTGRCRVVIVFVATSFFLAACGAKPSPTPLPPPPTEAQPLPTEVAAATATMPPASPSPTVTEPQPSATVPAPSVTLPPPSATAPTPAVTPATPGAELPRTGCLVGTGLREQTAPILLRYKDHPALVMSPTYGLAQIHFPALQGWIRVLGGPSLQELEKKAEQAKQSGLAYEALGYGLETGKSTPEQEWQDLVGSTQKAREIADRYGKLLVMGPGLRLMSENEDKYAAMAALADIWIFQTQRYQVGAPGETYRRDVERVVNLIRAGNSQIKIWTQITLPPDRPPNAEEWLAYRGSIADLVDGTYVGVYTWKTVDEQLLIDTVDQIFAGSCGSAP